jgi:hypothetical protein
MKSKKSTGRGGQTNREQNKQMIKQTHKKFQVQEKKNFSLSNSGVTPSTSSSGVGI